jgi:hypothetical protein
MKKLLIILTLFLSTNFVLHAQDENSNDDKIRAKMTEFIQRRLNLSKNEAEKFSPVFLRYFNEWRSTLREFRGNPDRLLLKQRIVDLQLRYRNEFKDIIGQKRSNDVFEQQKVFIETIKNVREEQIENRANRRFRATIQ